MAVWRMKFRTQKMQTRYLDRDLLLKYKKHWRMGTQTKAVVWILSKGSRNRSGRGESVIVKTAALASAVTSQGTDCGGLPSGQTQTNKETIQTDGHLGANSQQSAPLLYPFYLDFPPKPIF